MGFTEASSAVKLQWNFKFQFSVEAHLAQDKLYSAEYLGSGTFIISKPKRKKRKLRQQRVKSPQAGARK
jgi:hypothetical protein